MCGKSDRRSANLKACGLSLSYAIAFGCSVAYASDSSCMKVAYDTKAVSRQLIDEYSRATGASARTRWQS